MVPDLVIYKRNKNGSTFGILHYNNRKDKLSIPWTLHSPIY